jgi:hypothetical protein
MKKLILIYILWGVTQLHAGWYEVYSFKGMIAGKYPIELLIQTKDTYSSKNKKIYDLVGIYKYDKFNTPIALEGKIDNGEIELYVVKNKKKVEKFSFSFSKKESIGTWTNLKSKKSMPLSLEYVNTLDDRERKAFNNVEILQKMTLKDYYFVGVYMLEEDSYPSSRMSSLKIINKKTDKLFQEIDFTSYDVPVGNIMTIIFDHIEYVDLKNKMTKFQLWNGMGRMGGLFTFYWDSKSRKFLRSSTVHVEGQGSIEY